jgi:hypothetical protein
VIEDGLQTLEVNAVTLLAANRDVVNYVRAQRLQGLDEQGSGSLAIHVEIPPDTNPLLTAYSQVDDFNRFFDFRKWRRWDFFWVQERARGFDIRDAASDESLRDERV